MSNIPLNIKSVREIPHDGLADVISETWDKYNTQRIPQINAWRELRNFIFATDTSTTSNKSLPWKNSTTLPKLCQIRDNLHSNYISALFPNDDWLKWEAYSPNDARKQQVAAIEAYMSNKTRENHFRTEISRLLYDYIDYGNAIGTVYFEEQYSTDSKGERTPAYIGPRVLRISPMDIVFNPLAENFAKSFKIIRSIVQFGELVNSAETNPENERLRKALKTRKELLNFAGTYSRDDLAKVEAFQVDGYGNFWDYLQSGYVEMLTFYGDLYDNDSQTYLTNKKITVIDRMYVIGIEDNPSWLGQAPIFHVGWRLRPDNLWAMGPLENLVGMQYRIDHLENAKADAMDLAIQPPLVIKGEVEQFEWRPNAEIHIDENGDVQELGRNAQWVIAAENNIDKLEMRMEQYAGAPREAMGIRSAGEKTKFEVQQLQNAAGRIFQEKITTFETELLERLLNAMLEVAKRNMDVSDWARVFDDDLGVQSFVKITKEDITASGVLRPIGARHFAAQAQMVQNLTQLSNTPVWQQIAPHVSSTEMAKLIEDVMGIGRYKLIRPNVAIMEQQETQRMMGQAQEELSVEQSIPPM